jgi:hypothetical protein
MDADERLPAREGYDRWAPIYDVEDLGWPMRLVLRFRR